MKLSFTRLNLHKFRSSQLELPRDRDGIFFGKSRSRLVPVKKNSGKNRNGTGTNKKLSKISSSVKIFVVVFDYYFFTNFYSFQNGGFNTECRAGWGNQKMVGFLLLDFLKFSLKIGKRWFLILKFPKNSDRLSF